MEGIKDTDDGLQDSARWKEGNWFPTWWVYPNGLPDSEWAPSRDWYSKDQKDFKTPKNLLSTFLSW